jgi:hypothetical protein
VRGQVAEIAAVPVMAILITLAMAAPVLRAPSERLFGMEIVGRHHDPFTVMAQIGRPVRVGVYAQPVTDLTGALLARAVGPVAGYNWLVLLSFPLSAAAAYMLARHLTLLPAGAAVAAMAYAFSPFHVAQAAYHPHIAQTQWIPLYLLALWRCVDKPSAVRAGLLGLATMAVTLSNFYAGLIAAVITPVAVGAYWLFTDRTGTKPVRRLGLTVGALLLMAAAGMTYIWQAAGVVMEHRAAFAFPRTDLFLYSAKWWSYLVPPVAHPLFGGAARQVWTAVGVREGLLEQQVSLGWSIIALGLIAVAWWLARDRAEAVVRAPVPVLVVVAITAVICSLSPERTIGDFTFRRPSAFLYPLVPMFRSYARFGVVVQLMAALLAGIGVDRLLRVSTRPAWIACGALVILAAGEYAVSPSALWRDVLPTTAHRWLVQQGDAVQALDCAPPDAESESVPWLTGHRVTLLGGAVTDCNEPNLSHKLAANGYTHLLVRRGASGVNLPSAGKAPDGLRLAARLNDGQVFEVTTPRPAIYTAEMTGFSPRERDVWWTWRWMGVDASWTVVNTRARPVVATLRLEAVTFQHARRLALRFDGRDVQTLVIGPSRQVYQAVPLVVNPGAHELVFHPVDAPTVASDVIDNGDRRPLSFAIGAWSWGVEDERQ